MATTTLFEGKGFIAYGHLCNKVLVIELNGRKNVTQKIVEAVIQSDIDMAIEAGKLKMTKEEAWETITENRGMMQYYRNGINIGSYERKHVEFSERVAEELGKKEESYWNVSTQNSFGGYNDNEVIFVEA